MPGPEAEYAALRQALVRAVRAKGIRHERVLAAIGRVPRHEFVLPGEAEAAYRDEPQPIGCGQTISQPFTVAYQTQLLDVRPGERVLEIGTGSGYQAAVLAELDVDLFSIERQAALHERARERLAALGYAVHLAWADGTFGWPQEAPFDAILVTAGGGRVPDELLDQLVVGGPNRRPGRLVMPVGGAATQVMTRIVRVGPAEFRREEQDVFRFVPLVRGAPEPGGGAGLP